MVPSHSRSRRGPRRSVAVGVFGSHRRAIRVATVEFRLNQWHDVDAVDHEILDFAVDGDVDQVDAAHHDATEIHAAELGVGEVHTLKRCGRSI